MIFTTDPELPKSLDYQRVSATLLRLIHSGVTMMGQGWCISMSDTVYTLLKQQGINSKMIECQVTVSDLDSRGSELVKTIGTDCAYSDDWVSSHVVVITETTPPMIIDASIGHILPNAAVLIDQCLGPRSDRIFGDFQQGDFHITYQEKLNPKVPLVHQTSMIDRIVTDQRIFSEISLLKRLNYIGIVLSIFAVINVLGRFFNFW